MSLGDLQSWLLAEGVRGDMNKVVRMSIRSELGNLAREAGETAAEGINWQRLVLAGSILARSASIRSIGRALMVRTSLPFALPSQSPN